MFWYNKALVEFDLIQHQISFAGSSDVKLSFASPNITCSGKTNLFNAMFLRKWAPPRKTIIGSLRNEGSGSKREHTVYSL